MLRTFCESYGFSNPEKNLEYNMRQSIQEWTKLNLWKAGFKSLYETKSKGHIIVILHNLSFQLLSPCLDVLLQKIY